jgi:hypothetical protein
LEGVGLLLDLLSRLIEEQAHLLSGDQLRLGLLELLLLLLRDGQQSVGSLRAEWLELVAREQIHITNRGGGRFHADGRAR